MKNNRTLLFIIVGIVGLLFVMAVIFQGTGLSKGTVILDKVPSDLTVTVDGKSAGDGDLQLRAGTHKITGARDGFADKTITVTVKAGDSISKDLFLGANSPVGQSYLINHPFEGAKTSSGSSQEFDRNSELAVKNTPFIKELPQYGPDFRIDYGNSIKYPDTGGAIGIYIQASTPTGRQNALELIRQLNYDPADMEIIFTSLTGQGQ